eukprot:CAMPEP_0168616748 /NCGR_PEP_ID=MMETSP0449_2-20121227/5184_1 /TAXON_ID=1082188 /ORGANISM="Strombidium rassoulzadegani, Strain ras09" /LENGTH=128 /DNA_ID=CAMNT_0008657537 /DNA_START=80 /DNA_END=466 /DNA_ORIENTATION=+
MSFVPILLVHLDYYFTTSGGSMDLENFRNVWLVWITLQGVYVWILCPLTIVFYESNERLTILQRIRKTLKAQLPMIATFLVFIIVTSLKMRNCYIPEEVARSVLKKEPNYVDEEEMDEHGQHPKYYLH